MGLFDVFTGAPAKEAAAKNTAALSANKVEGTGILNNAQTYALGNLGDAAGAYSPLSSLAQKYGAGTGLYMDSLGANGAEGNARATGAFQAGPGYQWAVDQSLDGINRSAAARGGSLGGNTLAALSDRAGNMANQEFGAWQDRLGGLISPELSATGGAATGQAGAYTNMANVRQGTANTLANLGTNTTNGINDQTTQSANAEMAGSGNLWKFGMEAAKAIASGGTSLLGGGGGSMFSTGQSMGNPYGSMPKVGGGW